MEMIQNITSNLNKGIRNITEDIKNSKFLVSLQESISNITTLAKNDKENNIDKVNEEKVYEEKKNNIKTDSSGLSVIDTSTDFIFQDGELKDKYLGCFNDGQGLPLFGYRFPQKVKNVKECIELGTKSKYKYISLKNGDECWAGNSKYNAYGEVEKKLCNMRCKEPNSQTCGGHTFNQVYKTNYYEPEEIESKILNKMNPVIIDLEFRDENIDSDANFPNKNEYTNNIEDKIFALTKETFSNIDDMKERNYKLLEIERFVVEDKIKDIEKIDKNLSYNDFKCVDPINNNYLFLYITIIVVLVTIIFLYFGKKN